MDSSSPDGGTIPSSRNSSGIIESSFPTSTGSSSVSNICFPPSTNHGLLSLSSENGSPSSVDVEQLTCGHQASSLGKQIQIASNHIVISDSSKSSDSLPPPLEMEELDSTTGTTIADIQNSLSAYQTLRGSILQSGVPLVSNATLESSNKGKVIIIQVTDALADSLIRNPIKINQLVTNSESPFRNIRVQDVRINRKKHLIVLESIQELEGDILGKLPAIDRLGIYSVRCYQPNSDVLVYGVIGPLAIDMDLTDLKENMCCASGSRIINIERMKRKFLGKLEDSLSIKVTFEGKVLPSSIKIYGMFFKVRQFVPSPIQCYNCQRYGHTAGSCKTKKRCLLCSGDHNKEECAAETFSCANCKEQHVANSKDCKFMKQAKEVELMKVQEKVPHSEARMMVNAKYKSPKSIELRHADSNAGESSEYIHENRVPLYSQVAASHSNKNKVIMPSVIANRTDSHYSYDQNKKYFRSVEVQTCDDGPSTSPIISPHPTGFTAEHKFLKNLRNFIIDVFSINFSRESGPAKIGLADSAIRNHFGVDLRESISDLVTVDCAARKRKQITPANSADEESVRDEDVISVDDEDEDGGLFQTVEKKQVWVETRAAKKRKKKKEQKNSEADHKIQRGKYRK